MNQQTTFKYQDALNSVIDIISDIPTLVLLSRVNLDTYHAVCKYNKIRTLDCIIRKGKRNPEYNKDNYDRIIYCTDAECEQRQCVLLNDIHIKGNNVEKRSREAISWIWRVGNLHSMQFILWESQIASRLQLELQRLITSQTRSKKLHRIVFHGEPCDQLLMQLVQQSPDTVRHLEIIHHNRDKALCFWNIVAQCNSLKVLVLPIFNWRTDWKFKEESKTLVQKAREVLNQIPLKVLKTTVSDCGSDLISLVAATISGDMLRQNLQELAIFFCDLGQLFKIFATPELSIVFQNLKKLNVYVYDLACRFSDYPTLFLVFPHLEYVCLGGHYIMSEKNYELEFLAFMIKKICDGFLKSCCNMPHLRKLKVLIVGRELNPDISMKASCGIGDAMANGGEFAETIKIEKQQTDDNVIEKVILKNGKAILEFTVCKDTVTPPLNG